MNKPELEAYFMERDIRKVLNLDENEDLSPKKKITLNNFKKLSQLQLERFSRLIGYEFTCPDGKIKQKYEWLLKLEHSIHEHQYKSASLVSET